MNTHPRRLNNRLMFRRRVWKGALLYLTMIPDLAISLQPTIGFSACGFFAMTAK